MTERALDGVLVADFTWGLAGPFTTKFLADLGATVVRVEWASPQSADGMRTGGPYKDGIPGVNRSGHFVFYNANKYSITLNLKHPKGMELAKRLVSRADIVAENFSPGTMARLGLGYDDLRKVKQDIIMISLSVQGQTGRHSRHFGIGVGLTAFAGFTNITGWSDRPPVPPFGALTDLVAPGFAAAAVIAALIYRRETGKGQYLDLSQNEASLQFLAPLLLDYTVNGKDCSRSGNRSACAAPHGAYPCKGDDRWCAIAVFNDHEWQAFCRVLGDPPWTKERRFATLQGRKADEEELDRLIGDWTRNLTAEEVMDLMQAAGVAAGVVKSPQEVLEDPQLGARNFFWWLEHDEIGVFPHIGEAFQLSETPVQSLRPSPCLGQDTEYVLTRILGLSDEELAAALADTGVFGE